MTGSMSLVMAKPLLSEALAARIEPVLPMREPQMTGRPRVPQRAALTEISVVLKTGIPWEDVPQEMGRGCGMTRRRRLQEWNQAGMWERSAMSDLGKCPLQPARHCFRHATVVRRASCRAESSRRRCV